MSSAGPGFHPTKVLLDPCARAISGWDIYQRGLAISDHDNSAHCLKAVVTERDHFDFSNHPRPRRAWRETVIYELHPGGFSRDLSSPASPEHRGTFLGLIDALPYLQSLGITAIELLPSMAFDPADAPDGRQNYWGYSPLSGLHPTTATSAEVTHSRGGSNCVNWLRPAMTMASRCSSMWCTTTPPRAAAKGPA